MAELRRVLAAFVVPAALAAVGCTNPSEPAPTSSPASPTTSAPAAIGTPPPTSVSPTRSVLSFEEACTSEVLLPLMRERFDAPSQDLVIKSVQIERCRGGYAHVFAIPRENPAAGPQYESEQLYLRFAAGEWESVEEGTGITCQDSDISGAFIEACEALGYR